MDTQLTPIATTPQHLPIPDVQMPGLFDRRLARGPIAIVGTLIAGSIGLAAGMAIALLIVVALFSAR